MDLKVAGFKILDGLPASGYIGTQNLDGALDGKQLWWTGVKVGGKMSIAIDIKKSGKYKLSIVATKSYDYGIAQFAVDGKKAGETVDFYNANVTPANPPVSLGVHELSQGEHKLTVEVVGGNEKVKDKDNYMIGLQRLVVEPVE